MVGLKQKYENRCSALICSSFEYLPCAVHAQGELKMNLVEHLDFDACYDYLRVVFLSHAVVEWFLRFNEHDLFEWLFVNCLRSFMSQKSEIQHTLFQWCRTHSGQSDGVRDVASTMSTIVTVDMSCTYTHQVLRKGVDHSSAHSKDLKFDLHASKLAIYCHFWRPSETSITKELIPEEMWLRLVEWPGYLVLILVSSRFRRGSLLSKLGLPKNGRQDFHFSFFSKMPENFRRFFGICNTFSNISRCSPHYLWCEVKSQVTPEVWRWPSTAQEGHYYGPRSPCAGGQLAPLECQDDIHLKTTGPGGTVPCTSLGGPYLSCWKMADGMFGQFPCLMLRIIDMLHLSLNPESQLEISKWYYTYILGVKKILLVCIYVYIYIYTSLPMDKVMTMVQSFLHMFALELELPNSGSGR